MDNAPLSICEYFSTQVLENTRQGHILQLDVTPTL